MTGSPPVIVVPPARARVPPIRRTSRTANGYGNAPMDSFPHTLKVELVHQYRWATQAEARRALFGYMEGYYNRHRMHSALGYLTPDQAEQRMIG